MLRLSECCSEAKDCNRCEAEPELRTAVDLEATAYLKAMLRATTELKELRREDGGRSEAESRG